MEGTSPSAVDVDVDVDVDADILEPCVARPLPEVSPAADESDFPEAHEDPAQSEELERQQDA
ncbi:hypothetical protein MIZ03_2936 [Rhodoferax lithotrophicus]|uniref:Uncharacterized protein n=1 Tax=Rhodoferax lithotrophicus TaxID=2798804 RepID=A0ABM7MP15_9BURK|nr:hypothetical protein MIZ03_2936 [Rhodoferax sp. MIZ03]